MVDVLLTAFGAVAVVVAALSERLRRTPFTVPLIGLLVGVVLGPAVSGALPVPGLLEVTTTGHELTRLLLAVSVMAVALRYPIGAVRPRTRQVALLLLVAMPVMALVTSVLAAVVLGFGLAAAVLVGAALAPTDPVLAASTVTGGPAEATLPDADRQVLSLESGANDGLALPLVLAAVAVAGPLTGTDALLESVWQVLGAVGVGVLLGWVGGRALRAGEEHGSTESGPALVFTLVLALGVLGLSGLLHVDGVLAVFVAGLAFNAASTGSERGAEQPVDEAINQFLVLPVFVLFGAALPWSGWADLGWPLLGFVVAVLLLRRVPVILALHRPLGLGLPGTTYLAWFGPMGVSALFYLSMEADRLPVDDAVLLAGAAVVAASTLVHAVTSPLGLVLYRRATGGPGGAREQADDRHQEPAT
ncbi:cation:proton antiporter domain-containing protein [Thalassiella azotivora]